MAFPESFISELKARCDITEVVSSYVSLKRRGRNMVGLCPFHGEKTPSFNIYTESESFYCFGCGVGGDVITFIMKIENLDYVEAVKLLAQRAGMDVPENSYDDSMSRLRKRIFEANRCAARFYYNTLISESGRAGLDYFRRRALGDSTIRHFGLGFADADRTSLCRHMKASGFSDYELVSANLAVRSKRGGSVYDRFYDRVMFPIIDLRGNVIAFGGRIMGDGKPKYLNTSDTPVFKKSVNLFSLNNAKSSGSRTLILCEGYMDVIAVNQAGFPNAVATLGTALTDEQALLMKRYADEVVICYDSDEAGQKATARAISVLRRAGLLIRVLTVPGAKDPDEFIRSKGADGHAAFGLLIEKSGNDVEYRLRKLRMLHNTAETEGRIAFLKGSAEIIASISSPVERDVYITKISAELNVDKSAFRQQLDGVLKKSGREKRRLETRKLSASLNGRDNRINSEHFKKPRSSSAEEALIVYLIGNPDSCGYITSKLPSELFQNSLMRRFYEYFTERICSGLDALTNITADFSQDEASVLYGLLSKTVPAASTKEALEEYIGVIRRESSRPTDDNISSMTQSDIDAYLDNLRKDKK